ncbi:SRPBCC family protein [Solirubrobacter soli]|uniref:SRPBCC family protein n=1 Tax=Solirubrobacter soli TaxID=363832 RepID=UPI0003F75332|nr:SRPBCC family protein [Solirubrobacter soli]
MAYNEIYIDAAPATVHAVLSDAGSYANWVVGARKIRDADPQFPAVGSRFHHQVGVPPLVLNDHTEVLEHETPSKLILRAKTRPFGTARVDLRLAAEGAGTRVRMTEVAGDTPSRLLLNRLSDPLVHARNVRSLQRLRRLAERRV